MTSPYFSRNPDARRHVLAVIKNTIRTSPELKGLVRELFINENAGGF